MADVKFPSVKTVAMSAVTLLIALTIHETVVKPFVIDKFLRG